MISPELIRRYQFFADLGTEQMLALAKAAEEINVEAGQIIFREGDELEHFFLVLDGKVGILVGQLAEDVSHDESVQITGKLLNSHDVVSTAGPGEVFGWSGLVLPHKATSSARALVTSQIILFNCRELRQEFETDCQFAYKMMQKMAQVIRDRLRDLRVESLSALLPNRA